MENVQLIMKLIFISDLHLSSNTPEKNQTFYSYLKAWQNNLDGLYILGDFFDYWLGDDDDNQFIRETKLALHEFSRHTPIYFRGGNHDFAVGKRFAKETGITLIPDMTTVYTGKHKILLSHGDTFCTLDIGYQKMKRIIQNPITVFILCHLPLRLRYKIKELMERGSKNSNSIPKPAYVYNVVDSEIAKYATQYGADIIINGHTHHPDQYTIGKLTRYETPDWEDNPVGGYLLYNDGIFTFENDTTNN